MDAIVMICKYLIKRLQENKSLTFFSYLIMPQMNTGGKFLKELWYCDDWRV